MFWTILIGVAAGLVAKLIAPGGGPRGLLVSAALGVAGAIAATIVGRLTGVYAPGESAGLLATVVSAAVPVAAQHFASRRRASRGADGEGP